MTILQRLGTQIQHLFPANEHGQERAQWFLLALQSILIPITASRTSNLLRTLATVFGWHLKQSRFYTFMASPKLPWDRIWALLWRSIPQPLTDGRLLLALDDSLNPKTGKKVFACERTFDPAAKTNQNRYLWAQTLVTVGCYGSSTVVGPACPWPSPSTCVRLRCAGNSARSAANSRSSPPSSPRPWTHRAPGGGVCQGPGAGYHRQRVWQQRPVAAPACGRGPARASAEPGQAHIN
jgi:hypothetical protein